MRQPGSACSLTHALHGWLRQPVPTRKWRSGQDAWTGVALLPESEELRQHTCAHGQAGVPGDGVTTVNVGCVCRSTSHSGPLTELVCHRVRHQLDEIGSLVGERKRPHKLDHSGLREEARKKDTPSVHERFR